MAQPLRNERGHRHAPNRLYPIRTDGCDALNLPAASGEVAHHAPGTVAIAGMHDDGRNGWMSGEVACDHFAVAPDLGAIGWDEITIKREQYAAGLDEFELIDELMGVVIYMDAEVEIAGDGRKATAAVGVVFEDEDGGLHGGLYAGATENLCGVLSTRP